MAKNENEAMDLAFEKFPKLRPFRNMLKALCFKHIAGLSVREDFQAITHKTGLPWTFLLMHQLTGIIPDELTFSVPLFIIEVKQRLMEGTDYAMAFHAIEEVVFLGKEKIGSIQEWTSYLFSIRNLASIIALEDYGDHLYLRIHGIVKFNCDKSISDDDWLAQYRPLAEAWGDLANRSQDYWTATICRGEIPDDLKRANDLIRRIIPTLSPDINRRSELYCVQADPWRNKPASFFLPELS